MKAIASSEKTFAPTPLLVIALFATLFTVVFNYTLTNMAAIYIVSDLGGSSYMTTYTISFYAIGNAIGIPLGKPMAERLGPAKPLVYCFILFSIFSLACAIASNYVEFLTYRFLQGLVSGPLYLLVSSVFERIIPSNRKKLIATITLTLLTVVPSLGATFGGWIAYDYTWRWVFFLNMPIKITLACYLGNKLSHFKAKEIYHPFDSKGFFFFFLAVFSLGFVFTTAELLDWYRSHLIRIFFTLGVFSAIFFILHEKDHPNPLLNLKLLKNSVFVYSLLNLIILFAAYFGMIILLALWLNLYADYTPIWIAAVIGIMALAAIVPSLLMGKFSHIDCRVPLAIAILFIGISCFYTTTFDVEINLGRIAISRILAGFGLAFFLAPLFRLATSCFPSEMNLDALNIFQVTRALASGLGATLYTILWQRRSIFFHERLGEDLTVFSDLTKNFFKRAEFFHLQGLQKEAQLNYYLDRRSTSLALDDSFYLMGFMVVALFILMLFSLLIKKENFCPK